jgi:uncharacterized transporter YbjL
MVNLAGSIGSTAERGVDSGAGTSSASAMTKSFLFLLFLFGIGYSVGPQFMQAMKRDGLKPVLVALVVCFTGFAAAIFIAKALRLDPGFSAGLMSGSLTQSSAMGTATDAINGYPARRPLSLVAHTQWPMRSVTSSAMRRDHLLHNGRPPVS